jgi:hypothetical protein
MLGDVPNLAKAVEMIREGGSIRFYRSVDAIYRHTR